MATSPLLGLPFILPNQAQKHVSFNEAIGRLDLLVQARILSREVQDQPDMPIAGDAYILPDDAAGATWQGRGAGQLAYFDEGKGWSFQVPGDGFRVWDQARGELLVFANGTWQAVTGSQGGDSAGVFEALGINTGIDPSNRLSVKSETVRLSYDDAVEGSGDVRVLVNKDASSDVGSVLFQTNNTGHAEIGLSGNNHFSIRTSSDGSNFATHMSVDHATGTVTAGPSKRQTSPALIVRGDLRAETSGTTFHRFRTTNWYPQIRFENFSSAQPWHCTFFQIQRSRGTAAGPLAVRAGDNLAGIDISGHNGNTFALSARVRFQVDSGGGPGTVPGRIVVSTSNAQGAPIEALRITSKRYVGLGVQSPTAQLHLSDALRLGSANAVDLPAADVVGVGGIMCVRAMSGERAYLAFSDGVNWRRVSDESLINASAV